MKKSYSVYLPDDLKARIQDRAAKDSLSVNETLNRALESFVELDESHIQSLSTLSASIKVHPLRLLSNLAMSTLAFFQAWRQIMGPVDNLMVCLTVENGDIVRGPRVYALSLEYFLQFFERFKKLNDEVRVLRKQNMQLSDDLISLKSKLLKEV